jgi:hypothetical protein
MIARLMGRTSLSQMMRQVQRTPDPDAMIVSTRSVRGAEIAPGRGLNGLSLDQGRRFDLLAG